MFPVSVAGTKGGPAAVVGNSCVWIWVEPTIWPAVHPLVPVPGVVVAAAVRHSVVANGLPSWPPGRCRVTFSTGLASGLLNVVLTCSDGERTGSLFGQVADAVH